MMGAPGGRPGVRNGAGPFRHGEDNTMSHPRTLNRREFLKTSAAAGAGLALGPVLARAWAGGSGAPPNVVFVFSDQHQFRALGCYGESQVKTPGFDALARQGARCAGISTSPLCVPYRASMMSGEYASHTGILVNMSLKRRAAPYGQRPHKSVGATFKNAGYQTAYIGKHHLPLSPAALGFDYWALTASHHDYTQWNLSTSARKRHTGKGFKTDGVTDVAIEYLRSHKDKPFCLFMSWGPPHSPFRAPARYDHYRDLKTAPNVPKGKYAKQREGYYGLIEGIDDNFGRLMAELDKLGVAENTIVVYTSDHGEMMGAQGALKKRQPFTESSQVPLIVRWPGHIRPGLVLEAPIGTPDLFPTLAGLAGIDVPAGLDGTDRSGWLGGKAQPTGEEALFTVLNDYRRPTPGPWRGVRTGRYNYARTKDGPFVLFDLKTDPYEMHNLVKETPDLVKKFDDQTLAMMKKHHDDWPAPKGKA